MSYSLPLDSFDGFWSHPLKWLATRLSIYAATAAAAGIAFTAGVAVYAYLWSPSVTPPPLPDRRPAIETPKVQPSPPPTISGALVAGIGAPIFREGLEIGVVEKLIVDERGQLYAIVIRRTDKVGMGALPTMTVPYTAINWLRSDEPKAELVGVLAQDAPLEGSGKLEPKEK